MNKFFAIALANIALSACAGAGSSVNTTPNRAPLSVTPSSLQMKAGSTVHVQISGGSGSYGLGTTSCDGSPGPHGFSMLMIDQPTNIVYINGPVPDSCSGVIGDSVGDQVTLHVNIVP